MELSSVVVYKDQNTKDANCDPYILQPIEHTCNIYIVYKSGKWSDAPHFQYHVSKIKVVDFCFVLYTDLPFVFFVQVAIKHWKLSR
jgi:hypothetical protein